MSKLIALDFDGTICGYDGWKGADHVGEPLPGAREFILALKQRGYSLCIHTCRDAEQVKAWLKRFDLVQPIGFITRSKPPCFAYLDDRAIPFDGDFTRALAAIEPFKPWWQNTTKELEIG